MIRDPIVLLDVGGRIFRARKSTLTSHDGFFRKLVSEEWVESHYLKDSSEPLCRGSSSEGNSLFIDRDPHCFDSILSYLRSSKIYLSDFSSVYLAKLLDEAEFFMLDNLIICIQEELKNREEMLKQDEEKEHADTATEQPEVYKAIATYEVDDFFKRGYAYVGKFELPESASCTANKTATPMETSFTNNTCEACRTPMSYDKWLKHITIFRHTRVVVKRPKRDEDRFKFAQSPFRMRVMRGASEALNSDNIGNGSTIPGGAVPVSPVPDRTRTDSTMFPLTPGNFGLDQSF